VAKFVYTLDKASITNTGSDVALLTVTALDASNTVIAGVPITVALTSGSYQPLVAVTDASGQAKGNIGIGGDKANRLITATVSDGVAASITAGVMVTGANITISVNPGAPAPSAQVTLAIKATDAIGAAIPNAVITLTAPGFTGVPATVTTDPLGNATATGTAPAVAGSSTLTADGLGVSASQTVTVLAAGATLPNAVGPISAANLSINPNTIGPNAVGATTSRAALKAIFRNATNLSIPNVRVRFEITGNSGSTGEQVSSGSTTVYSDSSGVAAADYIAGTTSSPTNGVVIRACYGLTDADIANGLCPSSVQATMTVASQPLSVTLGSNNKLGATNGGLTYTQTLVVIVNDSAGVAVQNATISGSVDITHYGKGYAFSDPYYLDDLVTPLVTPPIAGQTGIGTGTYPVPVAPTLTTVGKRIWCENEDKNRNGFLDAGEDLNGNGVIEPRKADVVIAFPNGNKTDATGALLLNVMWPQNVATWLSFTVKVSTLVGGTEGMDQKSFFTTFIDGDQKNGSFLTPPHGVGACNSPN
jgi:hypothetical protein